MTIDFLIWLAIFLFISGAVIMINYWVDLFQSKEQYSRDELINYEILITEVQRIFLSGDSVMNYTAAGFAIGTVWLLTWVGGLLTPHFGGVIPDYAVAETTNYFFQSVGAIFILHLVWPSIREYTDYRGDGFMARVVAAETPYFFCLGCGMAAINLTMWGRYQEINFLFTLINAILAAGYASYRLRLFYEEGYYEDGAGYDEYADDYGAEGESGYGGYDSDVGPVEPPEEFSDRRGDDEPY